MGTLTTYTRLVANEPSVGMYFVQEHVRKSVPFVVATKARATHWQWLWSRPLTRSRSVFRLAESRE
jgi:BLOC-1-related complex sub-unit 8